MLRRALAGTVAAIAVTCSSLLAATPGRGRISGSVRDVEGNPVALARIAFQDARAGPPHEVLTDAEGAFEIILRWGTMRVTAAAAGFETWKDNFTWAPAMSPLHLDIVLIPPRLEAPGVRVASAGIATGSRDELEGRYRARFVGRTVVTRVDVKILRIKKQVRANRDAGALGALDVEQIKPATEVTMDGVRYRREARSIEWVVGPKGSALVVEEVDVDRTSMRMVVRPVNQRASTEITFVLEERGHEVSPADLEAMLMRTFSSMPAADGE